MDSKFYVSLKAARLLKEKGYNEECTTLYDCVFKEIIPAISVGLYRNECIKNDYYCSCPTKAEAIDWLESKGMCIVVFKRTIDNKVEWRYVVHGHTKIISGFQTRLEAKDAAIINVCELLENGN